MTGKHDDRDTLEVFFEAGRNDLSAVPSDALMQRIMSDAAAQQPGRIAARRRPTSPLAALVGALGGWKAVTGLMAATLTGVWIGFGLTATYLPAGLDSLTGAGAEIYLSELSDGFDLTLESEGS